MLIAALVELYADAREIDVQLGLLRIALQALQRHGTVPCHPATCACKTDYILWCCELISWSRKFLNSLIQYAEPSSRQSRVSSRGVFDDLKKRFQVKVCLMTNVGSWRSVKNCRFLLLPFGQVITSYLAWCTRSLFSRAALKLLICAIGEQLSTGWEMILKLLEAVPQNEEAQTISMAFQSIQLVAADFMPHLPARLLKSSLDVTALYAFQQVRICWSMSTCGTIFSYTIGLLISIETLRVNVICSPSMHLAKSDLSLAQICKICIGLRNSMMANT